MKKCRFIILYLLIIGHMYGDEKIPTLNIYTEVWTPFQYQDKKDVPQGFAVDLLDIVLKDVNSANTKKDFQFVPWARAISNMQNQNVMVFSMVRTTEREEKYHWVGPIHAIVNYVIVKKQSLLNKESFSPGNKITAVSLIDDASLHYLKQLNIDAKSITLVSNKQSPIRMLNTN